MNRRSFFRFACGGVAAAPMALVGERADAFPATMQVINADRVGAAKVNNHTITIEIPGAELDRRIAAMVRDAVNQGMRNFHQSINRKTRA